jgi:arylsulfatase A-like enzyme
MPEPIRADWSESHAREAGYPLDVNAWRGRLPDHLNQRARAAYFAYLAYLDAQIGRFLENLRRARLFHNTLTIFTADHGEMLGDHNLWRKTYAYEGSSRIPFIVCPPADVPCARNREADEPIGLEDILPTCFEATETPIPGNVEGRSLLPLLRGDSTDWREFYHGEHSPCYHAENAQHFLTDGRWKFVWNPITGGERLFRLEDDPDERRDLSGDEGSAAIRERFRDALVRELAGRDEGFSDGERLHTGPYPVWRGGDPDDVHLGY